MKKEIIDELHPVCFGCYYLLTDNNEMSCPAFFDTGIPDVIKSGENDHTKPVPGDHGIRFKPKQVDIDDTEYLKQAQRNFDQISVNEKEK